MSEGCLTATAPGSAGRALRAVFDELDRLRLEPPSDRELANAVAHLRGRRRLDAETNEGRCGRLVRAERFGLGLDYEDRYDDIIGAVRARDVSQVAGRLFNPSRLSVAVVGPEPVPDAAVSR